MSYLYASTNILSVVMLCSDSLPQESANILTDSVYDPMSEGLCVI